jgi:hypothetical protein
MSGIVGTRLTLLVVVVVVVVVTASVKTSFLLNIENMFLNVGRGVVVAAAADSVAVIAVVAVGDVIAVTVVAAVVAVPVVLEWVMSK